MKRFALFARRWKRQSRLPSSQCWKRRITCQPTLICVNWYRINICVTTYQRGLTSNVALPTLRGRQS
ncbi:hypothetical protein Y032_0219g2472 [Ancylostoma ceylanicum]|uniref:Uncharacterized protein n=1 Tax=Ancylostoma ceylanicum TaxID=53326 RepID=A0A016SIR6_9BILA|nr:hypothetical protein Y032_0219g2472 [Ancylostoma ceylanicum]